MFWAIGGFLVKSGSSTKFAVTSSTFFLGSEGIENYQSVRKHMRLHDGVRIRAESEVGFMPYAYAIGAGPRDLATTVLSLPASGGSVAAAVVLEGHMLLESVSFMERSSANARGPASFYIYEERLGNTGTLNLVTGATGTLAAFTPSAASVRTIAVTSPPVYLPPGVYWLLMRNESTARPLQPGVAAAGTMTQNVMQTQTLAGVPGATLDFVTGWTKAATPWTGLRLNGRAFGQATAF